MEKIDRIHKQLINKQFEYANIDLDYDRLLELNSPTWYVDNEMTFEQHTNFRKWAISHISKSLRINKFKGKYSAYSEFMWWNLAYGLKISDVENVFNEL